MTPQHDVSLIDEGNRPAAVIAASLFAGEDAERARVSSGCRVSPDVFCSWPRPVLEQLAADLYSFIQDLGPAPRERLEQHARYEAALRTIAEYGYASKDWQLARDTLNGK